MSSDFKKWVRISLVRARWTYWPVYCQNHIPPWVKSCTRWAQEGHRSCASQVRWDVCFLSRMKREIVAQLYLRTFQLYRGRSISRASVEILAQKSLSTQSPKENRGRFAENVAERGWRATLRYGRIRAKCVDALIRTGQNAWHMAASPHEVSEVFFLCLIFFFSNKLWTKVPHPLKNVFIINRPMFPAWSRLRWCAWHGRR